MDEMVWTDAPPEQGSRLELEGLVAVVLPAAGAALVSGNLEAAIEELCPEAPLIGLCAVAGPGAYALRIARDRALLTTLTPLDVVPGWHDAGYAVTPVDDGWATVGISGAHKDKLLAAGTGADLTSGSPSAAIRFAGETCLVVERPEDTAIWVERPMLAYLWHWIERTASSL